MNIFKNKLNIFLALSLLAIGTLIIGNRHLFVAAQTSDLFTTLGGSKTQVIPGDTLEYEVTVRNDGSQNLTNVYIQQNFSSEVTYVSGSATAEKNNTTVSVTDAWVTDGVNLGTLTPSQTAYFKFDGKISANVAVGSTVQNAIQVKSDQTSLVGRSFTVTVVSPNQTAVLRGGDFLKVRNNTLQTGWSDSLTIDPYQVAEFIFKVTNDGQNPARNVHISTNLSSVDALTQTPSVVLTADNAQSVTDTVSVTSSLPYILIYKLGHATLIGNTILYNCPTGCSIPDSFYLSPLNIGTVAPGESATIQVGFKADVIPAATATPTPTETPTITPTPTPTPTPTETPTMTPTATPTPVPSSPTSSCSTLTATTTSGTAPLTITFTGSGSDSNGSIQQYQFNFGDNSNGQNQIVTTNGNQASHVYYNSGNFTTNLIVKDSRGNWVGGGSCQLNINVNSQPTVLGASAPPVLPKTGSNDDFFLLAASIPTIIGGIYLYRRFRLL